MGCSEQGRLLVVVFTIRKKRLIRVISARDMSAKEKKGKCMSKKLKKIPKFKTKDEEYAFWNKHDVTDYFDVSKGKRIRFPNLKPSTKMISLRLPEDLLEEIKIEANKRDVPYQSYIKMLLKEKISNDAA